MNLQTNFPIEMDTNICRCCFRSGFFKDISTEYYNCGRKEVYEDMLKSTFNAEIVNKDGITAMKMICDDCIVKLRSAHSFKKMLIRNEKRFHKLDKENEEMLSELQSIDDDLETGNLEPLVGSDASVCAPENNIRNYESGYYPYIPFSSEAAATSRSLVPGKRKKRKRPSETITTFKIENNFVKEVEIAADAEEQMMLEGAGTSKSPDPDTPNDNIETLEMFTNHKVDDSFAKDKIKVASMLPTIPYPRSKGPILRENSLKLLEHSTICVFQWNKSRYRCFCCQMPFDDMDMLKEHTKRKHSIRSIERKIIEQQNRLIKTEISIMKCNICDESMMDLKCLQQHLVNVHKVEFLSPEHLLVPFKIRDGGMTCQICFENFYLFRHLTIHVNKHFQEYVCDICGTIFSSAVFFNLHKSKLHKPVKCKLCVMTFKSRRVRTRHEIQVHKLKQAPRKRFPCSRCDERFVQESARALHLVEQHGLKKPEYKCSFCDKVFLTRGLVNNHIKYVHLKERVHECGLCHSLFYTKSDLRRHRNSHGGEKNYHCHICDYLFASKDSLNRHHKKIHV